MSTPPVGTAEDLLRPKEVAELLRAHHYTVLNLIAEGVFPNAIDNGYSGNGRRYLVPRSDVERYLKSRRVAA